MAAAAAAAGGFSEEQFLKACAELQQPALAGAPWELLTKTSGISIHRLLDQVAAGPREDRGGRSAPGCRVEGTGAGLLESGEELRPGPDPGSRASARAVLRGKPRADPGKLGGHPSSASGRVLTPTYRREQPVSDPVSPAALVQSCHIDFANKMHMGLQFGKSTRRKQAAFKTQFSVTAKTSDFRENHGRASDVCYSAAFATMSGPLEAAVWLCWNNPKYSARSSCLSFLLLEAKQVSRCINVFCPPSELYEKECNGKAVVYWEVNYPFPMSNRDYTYIRQRRELDVEGRKVHVILAQSTSVPQLPERSGVIRVRQYKQSLAIESDGKKGSKVFMYYFDNPGGQIPTWLINWVAKNGVPNFLKSMEKACQNYCKKT
ncbi:PREDICTED: uncharacterized protein LOC103606722 [Galeopterus variegatus]|uniref:Uncharacterized protein LOC103606722 n=1 Tax=Galeopterus variegatus TaxID=482537 RepID=A0ABM0S9F3_GALVR|nr:PREDICTED: uncharacterized protein LOC103606722 [Galeopterus variegatus]